MAEVLQSKTSGLFGIPGEVVSVHPKPSGVFSALLYTTNFSTVKNKLGNELCYVLIREMLLLFKKESYNPLVNERMNTLSVSTYTLTLFFRTCIPSFYYRACI